jgi:endonuclease YncB( thermonuclease family)
MDFFILLLALIISIVLTSKLSGPGREGAPPAEPPLESPPPSDAEQKKVETSPSVVAPHPEPKPICKAKEWKSTPPKIPASKQLRGRAYIIDGDTIRIGKTKVRLAGIDAPELDQPYGQKSKWAMVRICKGQSIRVELTGETSYDRLVGTCYLPDGRDIGAELIKEGLAIDGGYYSKGKYRHLEQPGMRARLIRYGHRRPREVASQQG